MKDWASLILRICLGIVFVGHGLQKAFGLFGGPGINGFSEALLTMGFKPAVFWAYLAAYVELIGGLLLLLGIFTRAAAALILILMVVAALKVHIAKGFFLQSGGFEYTFVIACVCLALILMGPGRFAIKR
ncbi:MAG: DoxX family protein [Candidatus Omnitrophica bacterium]|nr:DoxX family protein [Candidatus Omnitrophota bacterium]